MLKVREAFFRSESSSLLESARERTSRIDKLFLLVVVLPTALATIYFGFLASDVYVSESQFVVKSPDKPSVGGLGLLLKSSGFSNAAGDEVYAAENYVGSRDALRELNKDGSVVRAFGRPDVSVFNRFNPFGRNGTFEDLYRFYRGKVSVRYDPATSIAHLSVKAFTPEDAFRFNRELLQASENVINRLNNRGRTDLVEFAMREVREAELADRTAALNLARFRNASGVVDPEQQAAAQLQTVSKLQDELIGARMQLLQLRSIAPDNPQIPVLETRIAGLAREVDVQMGRAAGNRQSLSASAVQYQRLQLDKEFADRRLATAMTALEDAQVEARRKQAYVERIAQPSLPDEAAEPERLRGILATLIVGLLAWGILKLLLAGVREHHG
jgi:BexC/CtrB/KpsE family polysaccharide export inner-membrane protein